MTWHKRNPISIYVFVVLGFDVNVTIIIMYVSVDIGLDVNVSKLVYMSLLL